MKIKAIAAICKKTKTVSLYDTSEPRGGAVAQWLGDNNSMYNISELPYLNEESFFPNFDIPEKQRKDYDFSHTNIPDWLSLEDMCEHESVVNDRSGVAVSAAGRVLVPFYTSRGLVFIDRLYLAPLSDMLDELEFYERTPPGGKTFIAAKVGLFLKAIIMPYNIINEAFVSHMRRLAEQSAATLAASGATENVDPETGEVLEGAK